MSEVGPTIKRIGYAAVTLVLLSSALFAAQQSGGEKEVWSLENSYWQYAKSNDMDRYRTLWHPDFLGWPYSDTEPAGKERITGWITAHTGKGETLKSFELEPLKSHTTGAYATVAYRVHLTWTDKDGKDHPGALRIIHTWLRRGKWQIISGMGAPTNAEGK
jgi:ketosteroid isomerase-like protein